MYVLGSEGRLDKVESTVDVLVSDPVFGGEAKGFVVIVEAAATTVLVHVIDDEDGV